MEMRLGPDTQLFVAEGPRRTIATVRYSLGHMDAERYVGSFLSAADALVYRVEQEPYEADALILPILFAYRHWLELRLKVLILRGQRLERELLDPMWTHNLAALWTRVRQGLARSLPQLERGKLDAVTNIIREITEVDPRAEAFRYAVTRSSEPSLPDSLVRVNVAHVAAVMRGVSAFLDGIAEGLAADLDALQDWENMVNDWDELDY